MFKFNLGDKVRDKITGFTGIVTCRIEYLNGCLRVGVQPQEMEKKDGSAKYPDNIWFDQQQCELVAASVITIAEPLPAPRPVGGPYPNPPSW